MAATLSARRSPAHLCLSRRLVSSSKATPSAFAPTAMAAAAPGTSSIADRVISLLSAADHPAHLAQIHALLLSSGLHHSPFLASTFLLTAPRSHQLAHARQFFDEIPHPNDPRLFNAVIRLHSYHNAFYYALRLYRQMLRSNIIPDGFTLPPVLKACGGLPSHAIGRAVHAQVLYLGFESDIFVQNGIISMYTKCRDIPCARAVFDMLSARNVVSWTSILSGCTQNGFPLEALNLYRRMRLESDVRPDFIILVSVLKAYTDVEDLEHGKSVHGLVIKGGFEDEPDLNMTLTAMYAKCGQVLVAKLLFDRAKSMDVIMWNTMISGYAKNGHASEAIDLFKEMISRRVKPDSIALRSAILACAQVGSLEIARQMENYTNDSEFKDDVFVKTALIDMYAKCGSIDQAHAIFMRTLDKDVVVWSAMITGYGLHGRGHEAMRLFNEMKHAGVRPNDVTFVGLLSACNHAGLVEEGWNYFHSMKDYGIEPQHQHYACVVDLLSRAGKLEKAYEFVRSMPIEPRLTVWGALLNACKIYGHVKLGEYVAEHVFALEPSNAGHYVKLSNIYASIGMWSEVAKVRVLMKERGVTKAIGCSMIDIKGELHSFRAGDKSHPRSKEIFVMLSELESKSHPSFSYKELYEITNGFAHQNILGEGGFGSVYKGCLSDGREVAVKRLKLGSGQGDREFKAEVEIISRVHHRHLVSLVGYCISDNQRLLVYDYVSNGTLESHLHGEGRPVMDWATRVKVAAGAARGIAYLHEDCHPRIIHRDIKSSNILLDNNFEAQVSDFGLARLAMDACTHVTTRVMGTFGYMAPEYASSGKLTEKSDVFSFGVVLLELITGRKPVDSTRPLGDESLVEWARPLLSRAFETGEFGELIDHRLGKNYNKTEMLRMIEAAAACTRHSASMRPQMGKVVRVLESLADIDLSNGITPGQSEVFNVAHSADIRIFQQLAFGNRGLSSDYSHSNWSHQTDM